ncbi:protein translocase subunit SecDF [Xanthovirga aplysinae]|uniref:protein translocase subunit SecDF n=1 Tax=Xanthovirga aplysinae TaxID=2529853 RepID=UPI0012BC7505|nr:protein translocase subunit SecDF [Xanthovirga aplysinae]MTI32412.1 protein translocase subunit SecDF [Xanthovirga aplysinae]
MRNKGFVIALTVIVSLLCIYYLSFTLVSRGVQNDAKLYATDANGNVNFAKRQAYEDSVWREPVYNLMGLTYTYQQVKETELNLGLDLQGGMHVTLEVSPVDIIKGLSGNSKDANFLAAIDDAKKESRTSNRSFTNLFYDAYKKRVPNGKLSDIFANSANKDRISYGSSDNDVLKILNEEVEQAVDRSFNILRTRIDRFGTSQPNIQRLAGTGRIQVEIPGADNPERVRKLLQSAAKLEFWRVAEFQDFAPSLNAINSVLVAEKKVEAQTTEATDQETKPEEQKEDGNDLAAQLESDQTDTTNLENLAAQQSELFTLIKAPGGLIYDLNDTTRINQLFRKSEVKALLPANMKFLWSVKPIQKLNDGTELMELYAVARERGGKAALEGDVVTDARQDFDERGRPDVNMQMNASGSKRWRKITGENIGRRIAIVLDDYVYTAPVVNGEIPGGNSSISGNFTIEEAKDLANILKAGTLPAPTTIVEEAIIGPTLGKEAQLQGITSIVAGLVMVVVFMIAYYSKGGLVANLALIFNIFFILGILAQLNAALTLAGIAGIVLTIGMAIDANVLIFERIKEEMAGGLNIQEAVKKGYNKAFSSIFDSNVTTLLMGALLYTLGQGPVKGFAVTLMIGIVCSFFSAVFISRLFIDRMSKRAKEAKISLETPLSKRLFKNLHFDFLSKRKLAYTLSTIFITIGMVILVMQGGLNLGVDFTGGRTYVVQFPDKVVASDLKTELGRDFEDAGTEVKTFGADNVLKVTTSYLIDDDSDEANAQVQKALIDGVQKFTGLSFVDNSKPVTAKNFTIESSSKVGATIADDIKTSSTEAFIGGLIVIFLYIFIRFRKMSFSLGAIIALFHDSLAVISAFAIARLLGFAYEVDQVFIAAMLTIIGYSINDTVVVFDRIREMLGLATSKSDTKTVFNNAINSTMGRTLMTSLTTLLVVLILFIFGGEVLRGFSFALLVGIMVGTYSSIFIATPIVADLSKKMKKEVKA